MDQDATVAQTGSTSSPGCQPQAKPCQGRSGWGTIVLVAVVVFVLTIILCLLVAWIWYRSTLENIFWKLAEASQSGCEDAPPITYKEELTPPACAGTYDSQTAQALLEIDLAVTMANCTCLLPLPTPPPFRYQKRVEAKDPADGQKHMFCYLFWNEQEAMISFTGTFFASEWADDLRYKLVPAKSLLGYIPGVEVHQGFYEVYLAARPQIYAWLREVGAKYKWQRLYISGHSLGGALSTLCAFDLAELGTMGLTCSLGPKKLRVRSAKRSSSGTSGYSWSASSRREILDGPEEFAFLPPLELVHYSFAAPRSGNVAYSEIFNQRVPNSIRVYNTEDVVPGLPLATSPNLHNRKCSYVYQQTGGGVPFTKSLGTLYKDHVEAYVCCMPKCDLGKTSSPGDMA